MIITSSSSNRLILYGGCNVQFSTFKLSKNEISFSGAAGTRKFCSVDNDRLITKPVFEKAKYVEVRNNRLFFYDQDIKEVAVFTTVPPS